MGWPVRARRGRRMTGRDRQHLARIVAAMDDRMLDISLAAALRGDFGLFEQRASEVAGRFVARVVRCGRCRWCYPRFSRRRRCGRCGFPSPWQSVFPKAA